MAEPVVDVLEVVEVDEEHRDLGVAARQRGADLLAEERAVRQAGERVVVGLVVQLLLQVAQLEDRLLEAVELQRGARVGGERLEEREVLRGEAAREAEAVGQHERADDPLLAVQDGQHAVAHAPLLQVGDERGRERLGERDGTRRAAGRRAHRVGHAAVDRLHRLARVPRAEARPQGRAALGAEEHDLGLLGAERLQRAGEQALERRGDLGRLGERAVGLVEELELLVALALGEVVAVAEEGDDERHEEDRRGGRAVDDDHGEQQREARVRHGDHGVHAEHLAHLLARQAALGEPDHRREQGDRQDAAQLGGGVDAEPCARAEGVAGGRVDDEQPDAGDEDELRQVEGELDRRQAPEPEGDGTADQHADHGLGPRGEDQREAHRRPHRRILGRWPPPPLSRASPRSRSGRRSCSTSTARWRRSWSARRTLAFKP